MAPAAEDAANTIAEALIPVRRGSAVAEWFRTTVDKYKITRNVPFNLVLLADAETNLKIIMTGGNISRNTTARRSGARATVAFVEYCRGKMLRAPSLGAVTSIWLLATAALANSPLAGRELKRRHSRRFPNPRTPCIA